MKNFLHLFFICFFIYLGISNLINIKDNGIIKNTLIDEFHKDDIELKKFKKYAKHFSNHHELNLVITKNNQKLDFQELTAINNFLSRNFNRNKFIKNFINLEDLVYLSKDGTQLQAQYLVQDKKLNPIVLGKIKELNLYQDFPINKDFTAISYPLTLKELNFATRDLAIESILTILYELKENFSIETHLIGVEYFRYSVFKEVLKSYTTLLPIIVLIIWSFLFYFFRSLKVIVFSSFILGFSFFCAGSFIYYYEGALSAFSSFSLLFVFVIATSDLIHLLTHNARFTKENNHSFYHNIHLSIKEVIKPCFLTSLTTIIGLLSLIASPFKTLQTFGLNGAIGIAISFYIVFYLTPWLIKLFKFEFYINQNAMKEIKINNFLSYKKIILTLGLISTLVFTSGFNMIKFEDDFYNKFTSDHHLTKSIKTIQNEFHHIGQIEILVKKENIEKYKEFFSEITKHPKISKVNSLISIKENFYKMIHQKDLAHDLFDQYKNTSLAKYFVSNFDARESRIIIHLKDLSSKTIKDVFLFLNEEIKKKNLEDKLKINGFALLRSHFVDLLEKNYTQSLIISFILIFLVFWVYLKSFSLSLLAMIPNLAPPLSIIFFMGLFGVSADMNLPLICSICLALSVDDTFHFFHFYKKEKANRKDNTQAIYSAIAKVSFPLILTTLIICMSLLVFTLGKIQLFSQFAIFLSLGLFIALIFDLLVLPAILTVFRSSK